MMTKQKEIRFLMERITVMTFQQQHIIHLAGIIYRR